MFGMRLVKHSITTEDAMSESLSIMAFEFVIPFFFMGFLPFAGVRYLTGRLGIINPKADGQAFMDRGRFVELQGL